MGISMKLKWIALLGMLIALPLQSSARELGGYVGLGMGFSVLDEVSPSTDTASSASKIYLGVRMFGPLGIEVGFYDLGNFNDGDDDVTGTGISAVGSLMAMNATLFAKAGVIDWGVEDVPSGAEINGTDLTYAIGIELPISQRVMFRTEWEVFQNIGEDSGSGAVGQDINMLNFGVNMIF